MYTTEERNLIVSLRYRKQLFQLNMSESNVTQIPSSNVTTNTTSTTRSSISEDISIMTIVHSIIGSLGIVANLTVVLVFLNHKKFRQKIPNIFIIHQVGKFLILYNLHNTMIIRYKNIDVWWRGPLWTLVLPPLLAMISLSAVQSPLLTFLHNSVLFQRWIIKPPHLLMPYLAIISSNADLQIIDLMGFPIRMYLNGSYSHFQFSLFFLNLKMIFSGILTNQLQQL